MKIKIVLCFIIISFLPVASARTTDNVLAAQSSGFIGSNDTLTFENYLVKAKAIDNEKANITIYKNQNKIEQSDFKVNDFREYENIKVTLFGIKGEYSWIAISKPENKEIWKPYSSKLLKWGEKYEIENCTISAETFDPESVSLTISGKNLTETKVFSKNSYSDIGNLRIVVTNINQSGFVELEFLTYSMPNIYANIFTDKDEYHPDETVQVTVNTTSDSAQNIAGIILESSTNTKIQPVTFSITNVTGMKSFRSRVEQLQANSTIIITATIWVRDYYSNEYTTSVSKVIRTTPVISVTKRAPLDTDETNVTVELYIYNGGSTEESVSIYDTVYENETLNLKQLNWTIKLRPGSSSNISYPVSPQKRGRYIFPPAIVKWKNYSSASEEAVMTVHGPLIVIIKSAAKKNNLTDVKLVINNSGDRPALVNVSDKIPEGYSIVSGDTTWSGLLEGGESTTLMYFLQGSAEVLPAASATYRDIHGVFKETQSNVVETIGFNDIVDKKTVDKRTDDKKDTASPLNAKPNEIISFMVSSFMAITGVITGVAMVAYLSIRLKKS